MLRRWRRAAKAGLAGGAILLALCLGGALLGLGRGGRWLPWRQEDLWLSLQASGVLRVCVDASYPPFEAVDAEGRFYGFDIDLASQWAARWGLHVQFVNIHFDGLYDALLAERCELALSALPYDRTMTRDVLYSQSYFNAGQVLLLPEGDGARRLEDLIGRRVAAELGGEGHQWLREWNRHRPAGVEIVAVRETADLATAMAGAEADAIVCDQVTAWGLMQELPLQVVGAPLTDTPLVAATRRTGARLLAQLDLALEEGRRDGALEALQARWFGNGASEGVE